MKKLFQENEKARDWRGGRNNNYRFKSGPRLSLFQEDEKTLSGE
jgi:hypothetical protein